MDAFSITFIVLYLLSYGTHLSVSLKYPQVVTTVPTVPIMFCHVYSDIHTLEWSVRLSPSYYYFERNSSPLPLNPTKEYGLAALENE
jgi:hypothetical protein